MRLRFMKSFKISNLETEVLFSSGSTRELINGKVLIGTRKGGLGLGGSEIFSQNNKQGRGSLGGT